MSKEIDLAGKIAVITGAGSGIGRATALLLASRGAKVHVGMNAARCVMLDDQGGSDRVAQADGHIPPDDVFAVGVGAYTERPRHES